jgi:hypothetical protein
MTVLLLTMEPAKKKVLGIFRHVISISSELVQSKEATVLRKTGKAEWVSSMQN